MQINTTHNEHLELARMQRNFVNCFEIQDGALTSRGHEAESRAMRILTNITVYVLRHNVSEDQKREVETILNLFTLKPVKLTTTEPMRKKAKETMTLSSSHFQATLQEMRASKTPLTEAINNGLLA